MWGPNFNFILDQRKTCPKERPAGCNIAYKVKVLSIVKYINKVLMCVELKIMIRADHSNAVRKGSYTVHVNIASIVHNKEKKKTTS